MNEQKNGLLTKKCQYCAENILRDAVKCRFCGEFIAAPMKSKTVDKSTQKSVKYIFLIVAIFLSLFFASRVLITPNVTLDKTNPSQTTACSRNQPYPMDPEFSRALSLFTQRASQDLTDPEFKKLFLSVYNCIDIRFASSDTEMNGAEGVFQFVPGQSAERLTIIVSPRYRLQDDIVTATLVSHEYSHALSYAVSLQTGKRVDCFVDEAIAFQMQNRFLILLNSEEKKSVISRLNNNPSPELAGISQTWENIELSEGNTYEEKALNYVSSNPFYQEQCAND